jgi:hypothetical protein
MNAFTSSLGSCNFLYMPLDPDGNSLSYCTSLSSIDSNEDCIKIKGYTSGTGLMTYFTQERG